MPQEDIVKKLTEIGYELLKDREQNKFFASKVAEFISIAMSNLMTNINEKCKEGNLHQHMKSENESPEQYMIEYGKVLNLVASTILSNVFNKVIIEAENRVNVEIINMH